MSERGRKFGQDWLRSITSMAPWEADDFEGTVASTTEEFQKAIEAAGLDVDEVEEEVGDLADAVENALTDSYDAELGFKD